jgi:long-subunit fatty acid transport protein
MTGYIATTTSSPTGMIYGPGIKYAVNKDLNFKMGYNIYNLNGTGLNTVAGGINSSSNVNGDILIYNIYISVTSHF